MHRTCIHAWMTICAVTFTAWRSVLKRRTLTINLEETGHSLDIARRKERVELHGGTRMDLHMFERERSFY